MSKRTLRLAAERKARKAERSRKLTAQAAVAAPSLETVVERKAPTPTWEPEEFIQDEISEATEALLNIAIQSASTEEPTTPKTQAAAAGAMPIPEPPVTDTPATETPLTEAPLIQAPTTAPTKTASAAQIAANRENAKLSSGPVTSLGKQAVSQNRRSHGLAGRFGLLAGESMEKFRDMASRIQNQFNPQDDIEQLLVDDMIQHRWLKERAVFLQEELMFRADTAVNVDAQRLNLFIRYQAVHERSYYKAMRELQNLQKQKRQDQIGFESQTRRQEEHDARVRLTHARAQNLEIDTACRQIMEVPLPGNEPIGFEQLTKACSFAIADVVYKNQFKTAGGGQDK